MTITVEVSPEVEAELARKAAAGVDVPAFVATLIEQAAQPVGPKYRRPEGRKSLIDLFAESPLYGLDLDFSRNKSTGRPIDL